MKPIDAHVGKRLQARRALCGLSQAALAERLDITFQQLQKYETGANRISASRLWAMGKILEVPVSYFFEEIDGKAEPAIDILTTRAGLELVRDFEGCSEQVQESVSQLCKAAADDLSAARRKKAK